MKRTFYSFLQWRVFVLLSILLFWSGCFVIKTSETWEGHAKGEKKSVDSLSITKPSVGITFGRNEGMIPIPFFFIMFNYKGYGAEFGISSERFGSFDSVSYSVYDNRDSLILKGIAKPKNRNGSFKCDSVKFQPRPGNHDQLSPINWCNAGCYSNYDGKLKFSIKNQETLRCDFICYLKTKNQENVIYKYKSLNLERKGKRVGSFF